MNFIIFNLKKMKNSLLHYTNIFVEGTPNLAFDNFFSFNVPLMAPVVARTAVYCRGSVFG